MVSLETELNGGGFVNAETRMMLNMNGGRIESSMRDVRLRRRS